VGRVLFRWRESYYYVESAIIERPKLFAAATIADGVGESYFQSLSLPGPEKEGEAIYGAEGRL
jgi:hypothetical protein